MRSCNVFECLWCRGCHQNDRGQKKYQVDNGAQRPRKLGELPVPENAKRAAKARFGHRSQQICGACYNEKLLPFCRAVNEEEPTEGEKEVLDCVEAFVDRDCGTGRARDRQGKHHPGVFGRRTCRVLFDLDRTSVALKDACSALPDEQIPYEIAKVFSGSSFSVGSAVVEEGPEEQPWPESGKWHSYFCGYAGIDAFKAQFCLYFLSVFADDRAVSLQAEQELEQHVVGGWGTAKALCRFCPAVEVDLPAGRNKVSGAHVDRLTLLLVLLYFSKSGSRVAERVRPEAKKRRIRWSMLHLEFLLCEVRKGKSGRTQVWRHVGGELHGQPRRTQSEREEAALGAVVVEPTW